MAIDSRTYQCGVGCYDKMNWNVVAITLQRVLSRKRLKAELPETLLTIGRDLFTSFRKQEGVATKGANIFKL